MAAKHTRLVPHSKSVTPPAITQVCRQTRDEALPMIYGNHTFCISLVRKRDVVRALLWVTLIGDTGILNIRKLLLRGQQVSQNPHSGSFSITIKWTTLKRAEDGRVDIAYAGEDALFQSAFYEPGPADRMRP